MGACHSSNEGYEWKQFVYRICAKLTQSPVQQKDWIYGPVDDGVLVSKNHEDIKAYNNKN